MPRSRICFCVLCAVVAAALAGLLFTLQPARSSAGQAKANRAAAQAADAKPKAAPKPVSFINDIAPLFQENCFGCHGAKSPKGKLDMTKYSSLRKGGTKDDPIVPGDADKSYLVTALMATDKKRMPPLETGDPLPKDKIALVERWIAEGAKLDAGIKKDADLLRELRSRWVPPVPARAYPFPVSVTALAFTPDGKQLVVSGQHELNVFDAASGKLVKRVRTRSRRTSAMAFLPDGKLVVSGGRPAEEGDVRVYDLGATGKEEGGVVYLDGVNDKAVMVKHLLETDDEVLCLALSKDGKKLATGGSNDRIVNVWDLSAGLDKVAAPTAIENHADWVFGVTFSADGKLLFTSGKDKTAKVWDLAAKESQLTFPDHQNTVYGVAVSGDGKSGFSVGEDNQLRKWNVTGTNAGRQVRAVGAHGSRVLKLVPVPGKAELVTCSADATVKVWNGDKMTAVRTLSGFSDHVFAVAVSADGKQVAAGAFNGEVRVWTLADGKLVKSFNASPGLKAKKE